MLETLFRWTFDTWYNAFISLLVFFNLLYWSVTLTGILIFRYMERSRGLVMVDNHYKYPDQVRKEIWQSMRSIFVFSLQGIIIQQGLLFGWFNISYDLNGWFFLQIVLLFLWNEIHFFGCHYLLHTRFMMKRVHWVHHHSKEPTVFSTFSFHWIEAFLLGTVIVFPLLVYPFQTAAILSLPIMSLVINLLGHCNYDFFSAHAPEHILKFSYRHSMHHKRGRGNLGFLLPWLDTLFKTTHKSI
ncbi:sterol desaturase family protein [Pedobacter metabolipauper]|uniref:Sterol desaturase/sphingolipid hydroxylase (Fatty acid hydroxylase superfamily) n=1 Tax=Pedobacter metabolipauper TaxID=425513 RepID=A0A4R6T1P7_9SPHI|nr:sterol desaturase family protein [Pedobacter metabolipauper]TDQ11420.1 sterol desaturase/sphingolipid hydroxylase (fatty acid hydroxylase superfamily) [Pedobacter metabolipauper]